MDLTVRNTFFVAGFNSAAYLALVELDILPDEYVLAHSHKVAIPIIVFATLTLSFAYNVFTYPFYISPLRHLPEPPNGHFLWGHTREIRALPKGVALEKWMNTVPNNGLIRYRYLFNVERILITDSKGTQEMLVAKAYEFTKPHYRQALLEPFLGKQSILFTDADVHKTQRRHMNPSFTNRFIRTLLPIFWKYANMLGDRIIEENKLDSYETAQPGPAIDMQQWASRFALDIIGEAGFDTKFGALLETGTPVNAAYNKMFGRPQSAVVRLMRLLGPVYNFEGWLLLVPSKHKNEFMRCLNILRDTCRGVVVKGREERGHGVGIGKEALDNKDSPYDDVDYVPKESSIINTLLSGKIGFSDDVLVDQCLAFLAAGHETTAMALTWAVYELCHTPSIQVPLRNEVRSLGLHDPRINSNFTVSHQALPHLYAFVAEVLRFHPPVPITHREALKDNIIMNQPFRKGTVFKIPVLGFNRSIAEWGPKAGVFHYTRYLKQDASGKTVYDGTGKAKNNYSSQTFLHGPRNCIGKEFAREELIIVLAVLIARLEWILRRRDMLWRWRGRRCLRRL